ncbi:MAG: hypothetical protein WDO68_00460 [Gammaproteobacteria bacterium]
MRTNAFVSMIVATGLAAAASIAIAQNATAPATKPARETPRPQDVDPAVNTSATPTALDTPSTASNSAASTPAQSAAAAQAQGAAAAGKPGAKGKSLDRLELDTTQITGNRELPKVLYIVPWKRSDLGDLVGKPVNSLLDEVLTPVDRDVFQRENRYYRALTPGAAENDALSAPDGRPATPVRNPVLTNSAPAAGSQGSAARPTNAPAGGVSTGGGGTTPAPRDEK